MTENSQSSFLKVSFGKHAKFNKRANCIPFCRMLGKDTEHLEILVECPEKCGFHKDTLKEFPKLTTLVLHNLPAALKFNIPVSVTSIKLMGKNYYFPSHIDGSADSWLNLKSHLEFLTCELICIDNTEEMKCPSTLLKLSPEIVQFVAEMRIRSLFRIQASVNLLTDTIELSHIVGLDEESDVSAQAITQKGHLLRKLVNLREISLRALSVIDRGCFFAHYPIPLNSVQRVHLFGFRENSLCRDCCNNLRQSMPNVEKWLLHGDDLDEYSDWLSSFPKPMSLLIVVEFTEWPTAINFSQLTHLELESMYELSPIAWNCNMPALKKIVISLDEDAVNLRGIMNNAKNLESISLSSRVGAAQLKEIGEHWKNLRKLQILLNSEFEKVNVADVFRKNFMELRKFFNNAYNPKITENVALSYEKLFEDHPKLERFDNYLKIGSKIVSA